MDLLRNFAYSTVATAPSPATSGTSLTVAAGTGALFPAPPFNLVVWPSPGPEPLTTNAEIVRVIAVSTDTFTIVRQTTTETVNQSRSILVGDQVMCPLSAKTITDIGLPSEIGALIACGHSWLNSPGSAAILPLEAQGRTGVLGRLASLLGVHEDNLTNLSVTGSLLTGTTDPLTAAAFGGWSGVLQFVLPELSANVYGTPAFSQGAIVPGALAGPPVVFVFGVNDPGGDTASWPTQGLNAWALALATVISRARASNLFGSTAPAGTITWDPSIVFAGSGSWVNGGLVNANSGPSYSLNQTSGGTVTITLPAVVPPAFTVAVAFIGGQTGYTTVATLGALTGTATGTFTVAASAEFPSSGSFVVKIDNEEMVISTVSGTTWTISARGVNGTTAAAHSGTPVVITAPDTTTATFSGTVANSTGTLALAGQGYAGQPVPIVKRVACTAADAGKTIVVTSTIGAGVTGVASSAAMIFDSWWVESTVPPPVVVANLPRMTVGTTALTFAICSALNAVTTSVVAGFDSAVQMADLDTPVFARSAELSGSINNAVTSINVVANGPNFPQAPGFRISVFAAGDANTEDMLVTAVSGTYPNLTLTVTRAYNGTAAAAHANNADITERTWWGLDNLHPAQLGAAVFAQQIQSAFAAAMTQQSLAQPYQPAAVGGAFVQHSQANSVNLVDNFYIAPQGGFSGTAPALNTVSVVPLYVPQLCVVVEADVNVTVVGTLSDVRLGIYLPYLDGQPGVLLADFGSVATAVGTGLKAITGLYQILKPGWYYGAVCAQGSVAPTLSAINTGGISLPGAAPAAAGPITGYFQTTTGAVTGALPSGFGAATGSSAGRAVLWLRVRKPQWG